MYKNNIVIVIYSNKGQYFSQVKVEKRVHIITNFAIWPLLFLAEDKG